MSNYTYYIIIRNWELTRNLLRKKNVIVISILDFIQKPEFIHIWFFPPFLYYRTLLSLVVDHYFIILCVVNDGLVDNICLKFKVCFFTYSLYFLKKNRRVEKKVSLYFSFCYIAVFRFFSFYVRELLYII